MIGRLMRHRDDLCRGCIYYRADYVFDDYDCECPDISDSERDLYFGHNTDGCPFYERLEVDPIIDNIDFQCLEYELDAERKVRDRMFAEHVLGGEV